jgi:hypothetical protein
VGAGDRSGRIGRWLTGGIALVLWQSGVFQGPPENTRQVYKADVKDLSGGSFVVSDPNKPAVKVTVPDVKMTTVPATPTPSPSASPAR